MQLNNTITAIQKCSDLILSYRHHVACCDGSRQNSKKIAITLTKPATPTESDKLKTC